MNRDPFTHMTDDYLEAARRLHRYLETEHWNGSALTGPDPGIRFNARIGRFAKSYLPFTGWNDDLVYLQAQGYWIMDNWMFFELTGDDRYRDLAVLGSDGVLAMQSPQGYWPYPNPEWQGRIATVEGCFAALGLLESFAHEGHAPYLEGALAWNSYMTLATGFRIQPDEDMLAVNYFAHSSGRGGGVPNNSTLVLWQLARLFEVTGNDSYLDLAPSLIRWLGHVQLDSGELPYRLRMAPDPGQVHFLCHQYNAFEFMDLIHYRRITGDDSVSPLMERLAGYLATGFAPDGHARYDCNNERTKVLYYTAALAQALQQAESAGFGVHREAVTRGYGLVLAEQRPDGGFRFHSKADYGFLRDRRSYPRYLSMILHHLLLAARSELPTGRQR